MQALFMASEPTKVACEAWSYLSAGNQDRIGDTVWGRTGPLLLDEHDKPNTRNQKQVWRLVR